MPADKMSVTYIMSRTTSSINSWVAQMAEHLEYYPEVAGSNPVPINTICEKIFFSSSCCERRILCFCWDKGSRQLVCDSLLDMYYDSNSRNRRLGCSEGRALELNPRVRWVKASPRPYFTTEIIFLHHASETPVTFGWAIRLLRLL